MSALRIKNTSENNPRSILLGMHKAMQIHSGMSLKREKWNHRLGASAEGFPGWLSFKSWMLLPQNQSKRRWTRCRGNEDKNR